MTLRRLRVALAAALTVGILILTGQPALASTSTTSANADIASSQGILTPMAYRPFTSANFRYNLVERTGVDPANCQAHHTIPQKFDQAAGVRGINIHDPIYGLWWNSTPGLPGNHQSLASQYNQDWQNFFDANRNATREQILAERDRLVGAYQGYYQC